MSSGFPGDMVVGSLPAGYLPETRSHFPAIANDKLARVIIQANSAQPTSAVTFQYPLTTEADAKQFLTLDGISFRCGPAGQEGCP